MRAIRLLLVCAASFHTLHAQDPFEINVYEYEPLPLGSYTYEAHVNYVLKGTRHSDGSLAPSYQQLHFSSELTMGLSESFAAGFVLLTAKREGGAEEYAGWRVVPHFYAPLSWNLPFRLGLVTEFSSQSTTFEMNSKQLEIRPIIEKLVENLDVDFNRYSRIPWDSFRKRRLGIRASGENRLEDGTRTPAEPRILRRVGAR